MMNTKALLRLADKLEGVGAYEKAGPIPRKHFDLDGWLYRDGRFDIQLSKDTCGTTACACGWAMLDPWFRRRGYTNKLQEGHFTNSPRLTADLHHRGPVEATMDFFGINGADFDHLFSSGSYRPTFRQIGLAPTPHNVAKRIRALVAEYERKRAAA